MATPYLQKRVDRVASTQDVARGEMSGFPLLVLAPRQTKGRGRSGSEWLTADRALAASLAFRPEEGDVRPFSLMAGVAAVRASPGLDLKWPNDLMRADLKVGGILVERSDEIVVVGLGLNLWWPDPPDGAGAIYESDPGTARHAEIGALWGAELMDLVDSEGWPRDEYTRSCSTTGAEITWEPDGRGRAIGVAADGSLVVHTADGEVSIYSGAVAHVRPA